MSLHAYSKDQLQEMSLIEIAYEIFKSKKEAIAFNELMAEISNLLELSDAEVKAKIAQFYTDLNIDGRFLGLGENRWGLRVWYPIEQVEEEVVTPIKVKKKKAKKATEDEDIEVDDFDELDEEEIDYDEIDDYEEDDDEILEDDDLDDEEDDDLLDEDELDDDLLDKDDEFDLSDEDEEIEEEDELDED
ncbi:DNA-directed RNA polymerase subunit delta [Bacillus sp. Bva_UNVM-123]|uniref:DNA-directed RNA polymerase subunit delta n=1 Tax=Bacillus sp. Bva_UNVM-123 TaxID=2829798 RepID=UPI00391F81B8